MAHRYFTEDGFDSWFDKELKQMLERDAADFKMRRKKFRKSTGRSDSRCGGGEGDEGGEVDSLPQPQPLRTSMNGADGDAASGGVGEHAQAEKSRGERPVTRRNRWTEARLTLAQMKQAHGAERTWQLFQRLDELQASPPPSQI